MRRNWDVCVRTMGVHVFEREKGYMCLRGREVRVFERERGTCA